MNVRRVTESDIACVLRLHALPHIARRLSTPDEATVRRAMEAKDFAQFIAFNDETPCGLLVLTYHERWMVEIRRIAAAQQRCGIGRGLLRWALRHAFEEREAHRVYLEVAVDNAAARLLYEAEGFRHEGTFRHGYRDAKTGAFEDLCAYGILQSDPRPAPEQHRSAGA